MFAHFGNRLINRSRLTVALAAVLVLVPTTGVGQGVAATKAAAPTAARSRVEIRADWVAFFDAKTPATRRIQLLQDGKQFASVIREVSRSPLAAGVSASVSKVALSSSTRARVTYSILDGGAAVLSHQTGAAVYQGGVWKVGDSSFCALATLEAGGKAASLPAACRAGK